MLTATSTYEASSKMNRSRTLFANILPALLAGAAFTALGTDHAPADDEQASVSALAWMTGTWAGSVGPGELEENWTTPKAGAIQAVVRMTGGGETSMVELIVIEEEEGTLRLRLQQWDPGFKPRMPVAQAMKLVELGENTVAFKAETAGDIAELRYTRDGENFTISIVNATGAAFDLPLKAR